LPSKKCSKCGGNVSEERDIGTSYFACDDCGSYYGSKPNNEKPGKHLKKGDDGLYYSVKKRKQPLLKSKKYTSVTFSKLEKPACKKIVGRPILKNKSVSECILNQKKCQEKLDVAYVVNAKKIGSQISYKSPHALATKIIGMNVPKPMWVHDNKRSKK
jgi:hypothetical protein